VFIGFISYPLYLVHDNIVVGLTQLLGQSDSHFQPWLYPTAPIALVICIAFAIAQYAEPNIRRFFEAWIAILAAKNILQPVRPSDRAPRSHDLR
jgi:peptidoglycan/LPS O-acetylase OafA/YrhL